MAVFEKVAEDARGPITEVQIKREDAMRGRLRIRAPDGEDLVIDLPRGLMVRDRDIFGPSQKGTYYRTHIVPEPVLKVTLMGAQSIESALRLGYSLGNHHLEVLVDRESAYLPLTLGAEKLREILRRTGLPVETQIVQKVISPGTSGYFAGEEEEGA